jgi:hypothetical protein
MADLPVRRRPARWLVVGVAVAVATVALAVWLVRPDRAGGSDRVVVGPAPVSSTVIEVRRGRVSVPPGYSPQTVEFADSRTGFASFVPAGPDPGGEQDRYEARLFRTIDGGWTWQPMADPRPPSVSPQLYTVDARTLVLLGEPHGWWVSRDAGETFQHQPGYDPPAVLNDAGLDNQGDYRLDCPEACRLTRRSGPPVTQPPLPGSLQAIATTRGVLWAASVDGVAYTAASADGGRTWRQAPVPPAGQRLDRVDLQVSPDGRDLWLVGSPNPVPVPGFGTSARRKEIGIPVLWTFHAGRWVRTGRFGQPAPQLMPYPATAVGGGYLAVVAPDGLYLVDQTWRRVDLSPRPEWARTLPDGTIVASAPTNRTLYLGRLAGPRLRWIQVEFALET